MNLIMMTSIWKKLLVGCMLLGMLAPLSAALNVSQFIGNNTSEYVFSTDIANNTGVTLDSATLDYSQLFLDTANLAWNVAAYDGQNGGTVDGFVSLSEFLPKAKTDGDIFFGIDSIGDVYTGWSGNIGNDGIVDITGNGFEESWNTTETMETFLGIDNSLLTDPATSTIVPISLSSTETITDFATADDLNINTETFTADGFTYEVVPEPSLTAAVLGLLSLGLVAVRRRA